MIVAALVLIDVAAPSVQGAATALHAPEDAWQGHCGDACSDPAGGERPCGEDCLCYFCHASGMNTWMLSPAPGLPVPLASAAGPGPNELLDPKDVSLRVYHPPKF